MTLFKKKKKCFTFDIIFFEKQAFFPHTSLQGENVTEDKFWETLYVPLFQIAPFQAKKVQTNPSRSVDSIMPIISARRQPIELGVYSRQQSQKETT